MLKPNYSPLRGERVRGLKQIFESSDPHAVATTH